MSILRNMSNLLFGVDRVSNTITNEPPRLLAQRMATSSKLNTGDTDIKPLSEQYSFAARHLDMFLINVNCS